MDTAYGGIPHDLKDEIGTQCLGDIARGFFPEWSLEPTWRPILTIYGVFLTAQILTWQPHLPCTVHYLPKPLQSKLYYSNHIHEKVQKPMLTPFPTIYCHILDRSFLTYLVTHSTTFTQPVSFS